MSELSKKKNAFENAIDKPSYNINSFRGLNMDRNKQNNEIKINNKNLTSRIISELNNNYNYKHVEKARTISKNKAIGNKILTASKHDLTRFNNNKTILEMSFNQKNSPKKLFAGTSKKNNYLQNHYQIALTDKNTNGYIACLTEDSEPRTPQFVENIDKNFKKIVNTEKNNRAQQPGAFFNTSNNDSNIQEKSKLNFNYKKPSIQLKPIRINATTVTRREIISPTNKDKENITNNNFSNVNETHFNSSLIHNSISIMKTHESIKPEAKRNFGDKIHAKRNNFLSEFITEEKDFIMNNTKKSNKSEEKIKLEDGISINIIKSHGEKRIKKFLHVPDFEIFVIKEIPLNNDSIQDVNISERIKDWNSKMSFSDNFVKIYKEHINSPEGYISLVYEYMDGFSLGDIIENFGCLSENLVQKFCNSLLKCLVEYEEIYLEDYGELCPCNILFDKYGNLKLNPRIFNCYSYDKDPLNPKKNNLNDFFNKCNCNNFFHNNLRNKIRTILRELTKETQTNQNENNVVTDLLGVNTQRESNVDSRKNSDANRNSSNNKFKASSNNSTRKNTSEYNYTNYNLKIEEDQKSILLNEKYDNNDKSNSKLNQISKTQRKENSKNYFTTEENEKLEKQVALLRSNSQKSKQINKLNLNNHFISEKNIKSRLNMDKTFLNEFTKNPKLKQNLNLFHNNNNKKDIMSNENSKGFSNYNPNYDSANYFNRKSSLNGNSNSKFNTNESNRIIASNSNGMSEVNQLQSFPSSFKDIPHQIILNTDSHNNKNKTREENGFENSVVNEADKENKLFTQIRDGIANIHNNKNSRGSLNNHGNKKDPSSSNDPKISIMNDFVLSSDKGHSEDLAGEADNKSKDRKITLNDENENLSHLNNNYFAKNLNKDDTDFRAEKENQIKEKYFSENIAKTEGNNAKIQHQQNYNSNEFSNRRETQLYLERDANTTDRVRKNNMLNIDTSKIKTFKIDKKNLKVTNFDFPKQYFSLGYILIILACKSIKLKVFEYLENLSFSNLEEIKAFKLKKCCLYHFLISLEDGLKINKNYSIENFFKSYSEEFKNFICNLTVISLSNRQKTRKKCLQGYPIFYLNAKSLMEHIWIKSEKNFAVKLINNNSKISNMKLSLREVIKIVRESFKTSLVEFNEKKYENVLNKVEVILNNHRSDFKVENIREVLDNKKEIIKKVSFDIGVNFQDFYEKILGLVEKMFSGEREKNK